MRGLDGRGRSPVLQSPTRGHPAYQSATGLEVIQLQGPCMRGIRRFHLRVQICSWIRRADSPFPFLCSFVFAFCRAAAIELAADTGKSGLRTRPVLEFRGASWLCPLDENPPLSRSPGAGLGTNPDQAEKQHAPHSARQSAHQHTPNRKQEAQQGGFTIQLICP